MIKRNLGIFFGLLSLILIGCSTEPRSQAAREDLSNDAQTELNRLKHEDASLDDFLSRAYGYAVFPSVGKGGALVGGAYGHGVVYQGGQMIGYADLRQATVGLQLGGQTYTEVIAFETKNALDNFKSNNFAFSGNASAVALKSGAAATAKYDNGVAVFTAPRGGLMFEASIGGQQFTYTAK